MAAVPDYTAVNETPAAADVEPMAEPPSSPTAEVETEQNDADADVGAEEAAEAAAEEEATRDEAPPEAGASVQGGGGLEVKKWPGWPGDNVFRLIVPLLKVGSIIGRKGELIKKLCEETKARVRILEGPIGVNDRIVLISGKEEPEAEISPAMDAVVRIFKRVNGISDIAADGTNLGSAAPGTCSVRLLVAASQAVNLIGKKGEAIRTIQESSNATVRVLTGSELPLYAAPDERTVEIQGEPIKVLKGLEAVIQHLRKFLVDHSVLPLFEKSYNAPVMQDRSVDAWGENTRSLSHTVQQSSICNDYGLPLKHDSYFYDHEPQLDSQIPRSGLALYGQDPAVPGLRSSALGRSGSALEVTHKMQIPLMHAEDIIGLGGGNIAYIRRSSGAFITVQETRGLPDEITVEVKGTTSQVHLAQQLIQEFIAGRREPLSSSYEGLDTGLRSSYSQLASPAYRSSSHASQSYGSGYRSSGLGGGGGYGGYRL
ncbi:unnamed protein product [Musa acuminata var. zebrina]